jgi:hypothetical protein
LSIATESKPARRNASSVISRWVRRHGDRCSQAALRDRPPHVGPLDERFAHVADEARDQVAQRELRGSHPDPLLGPGGRRQKPLERSDDVRSLATRCVETVGELAAPLGDDRRDPLDRISGRIVKADDRVVAAVRACHDRSRGSEVDAEVQWPASRDEGIVPPLRADLKGRFRDWSRTGHVR